MKRGSQYYPLIPMDYPDPDVIRVENTYYMVTTTMHFMPGCEILRSYDLVNWEHLTYVYDVLDCTPKQTLQGEENAYGKGMWAASLRYHKGIFYLCFVANDTGKTYLFRTDDIEGTWIRSEIKGFYHDASLLFDEGKVFIAYGNKNIYLTELKSDLSGPLEGGLHRFLVSDAGNPNLGYEGTHFYKINGKYYLFFIHSKREEWRRVEACYMSDSLQGEFTGGDVFDDDNGYCYQGIAQGGIVDTPEGDWFSILFQDYGAVGRIPVLVPVTWKDGFPEFGVNGKLPTEIVVHGMNSDYQYTPLYGSDDFKNVWQGNMKDNRRKYGCFGLKSRWQFNHIPDLSLITMDSDEGKITVRTDKLCDSLTQAKNILTQRMKYPGCAGEITVDASGLENGDYAGICALQADFGMVAITKKNNDYFIVMGNRDKQEYEMVPVQSNVVELRLEVDFTNMTDVSTYYYKKDSEWIKIGINHKLKFDLAHFVGCRFGLFVYSTKKTGGSADFMRFHYVEKD